MKIYFPILGAIILSVTGRDAERYLQARLTNNIKALPIGKSCLAAALTPLGKTQALMTVLRVGASEFLLWIDGGDNNQVIGAIKKYLVADRVDFEDRSEKLRVYHLSEISNLPPGSVSCEAARGFGPGHDCLVSRESEAEFIKALVDDNFCCATAPEILMARIKARLPRFPEEINEDYLFADADLQKAVAINKGCYVGHEVLERVDARGKAPHRLISLVTNSSVMPKAQVKSTDKTLGTVVTVIVAAESSYCFAYIKNIPDGELPTLNIDGAEVLII